jgi:hypothetical protein
MKLANLLVAGAMLLSGTAMATDIMVYKTATCWCCKGWVQHLQASGFHVIAKDLDQAHLDQVKVEHHITPRMASCHTAVVAGYVIEGHVPARDIKRLLSEKPKIAGLAVPGMPSSAPGMDMDHAPYNVIAIDAAGNPLRVFARH